MKPKSTTAAVKLQVVDSPPRHPKMPPKGDGSKSVSLGQEVCHELGVPAAGIRQIQKAPAEASPLHSMTIRGALNLRSGSRPRSRVRRVLAMRHTTQLQVQREAAVGQLSRSYRGEENGEVEVTGFGPEPRG